MKKYFLFSIFLFSIACNQHNKKYAGIDDQAKGEHAKMPTKIRLSGPDYLSDLQFINDYPTNFTVDKLYDAIDFQRACQAYIWAMPAVALHELYIGNHRDIGAEYNEPILFSDYLSPDVVGLTGNNSTIYAIVLIDLSEGEPIIIESPAGIYGVIDDLWQRPITEIGVLGPDKGKGGKFLILPPNYQEKIAEDYYPVVSTTNKAIYIGRSFVKDNNIRAAADSLKNIKVYTLKQENNPPANNYKNGNNKAYTIAPRGYEYWQRVSDLINGEPIQERDRFFLAMLKPLGIEKGKPFEPNEHQKKILTQAADIGFRMAQVLSVAPRGENVIAYPGTHWEKVLTLNSNQETENYSQLDERTDYTFEAITVANGMIKKIPGAGSQYYSTAKDRNGDWLDGGKNYKLHIPPNIPAKEFWSITVYDNSTRSMIQNGDSKVSIRSNDEYQKNEDGSIDIYFGPDALTNKESNWIKTLPNKGWFTYFRWYGPTEAFFDKSWKLKDIEPIQDK